MRYFRLPSLPMTILLLVVGFLVLTPLALMILNSFQIARPGQPIVWGLEGWVKAFSTPGIIKAMTNTFTLAITRQAIALLVGAFFAWLVARTDLPMKGLLNFSSGCLFSASLARDHGMDPFARPKIWPAQSRADRARCGKSAVVQHLFILGHCLGSYGWHRERQSYAARAGLSQSRRGARRVLAYLRREWLAYFFHIIIPVMMPAIS